MVKESHTNKSTTIGDVANILNILNSIAFVVAAIAQYRGFIDIFSKSFVSDGFCVSNQDKSVYVQSHLLCFYADSAYAVVLWILTSMCATGMAEESLQPVRQNILGIFFHGCGHMYIAFDKYNGEGGRMGQLTGWEMTRYDP